MAVFSVVRLHLLINEGGWKSLYWGERVTYMMRNDKISSRILPAVGGTSAEAVL